MKYKGMRERKIRRNRLRALLCRKLLKQLETGTPPLLQSLEVEILLHTTARAFGKETNTVWTLSPEEALREYAMFTVRCMQEHPDAETARRLYRDAWKLGRCIRRVTGFTQAQDLQRLIFYLYRGIGITMEGQIPGEIRIPSCYFSRYYTPYGCRLMSCMDAGIISGICDVGKLKFIRRITQGDEMCAACISSCKGNGS